VQQRGVIHFERKLAARRVFHGCNRRGFQIYILDVAARGFAASALPGDQ
jgi:hypothetical protein